MSNYGDLDQWELGRKCNEVLLQLGRLEEEIGHRRTEDCHLIKSSDMIWRWRGSMGHASLF